MAGIGQVVTLTGEPGVGKSRLVAESLSEAAQDGWLVQESVLRNTCAKVITSQCAAHCKPIL